MSRARLLRLQSDYEAVRRLVTRHPRIDIEGVQGNPPERYRLLLRVASLREIVGQIVEAIDHRVEVVLGHGYPRDAPVFRMLTPVFHPNIAPHAVCIGDHWTASESLDNLIQRVGEMLALQSYNLKSPLNGRAAQWVAEHPMRVPTDRQPFFVDLEDASQMPVAALCANCAASSVALERCASGHSICGDCQLPCVSCESFICLACDGNVCQRCATSPPAHV